MAQFMPQQENTTKHGPSTIGHILITLFWAIALFYFIAIQQNIDVKDLIPQYVGGFYIPHYNSCLSRNIGKININSYFYLIIFFSVLTLVLFRNFLWKSHPHLKPTDEIQRIIIIVLGGMMIFQTMNQIQYFAAKFNTYHGKNIEARLFSPLKETYDFARYCQQKLPGRYNAELITDIDTSKDPGMFTHRALAYYLYPIDIRNIRKGPQNCLIGFKKRDAATHIPQGYEIIGSTNKDNILAIRVDD